MRVLFLTAYMTTSNLKSSSTVFGYGEIARSLVKRGHVVYWYVPRGTIVDRNFPDEFLDHPQIKLIETGISTDQYYEDCNLPPDLIDLFHQQYGKYQIDAVVTSKLNLVGTLQMLLQHIHDGKCPELRFYGIEIFPKFREIAPIVSPFFEQARAAGWRACSRIYWGNPEDLKMASRVIREVFSPSDAARLTAKSYSRGTNGIPLKALRSATDCTRETVNMDGRVDRVQFFGRPWGDVDEFEDAITVYEAGFKCEFLLSLPGGMRLSKHVPINRFGSALNIQEGVSRKRFYKFLKTSKVGVNIQRASNFPTMHMEALYAGVVLVMPRIYWWESFWPDYPFLYRSKAELVSMVKFVLSNYERAVSMIQKYREAIDDQFDSVKFAEMVVSDMESGYTPEVRCPSGLVELIEGLPDKVSFDEVCTHLKRNTRIAMEVGENPQQVSRNIAYLHPKAWLRGMLLGCGFTELPMTEELVYERTTV